MCGNLMTSRNYIQPKLLNTPLLISGQYLMVIQSMEQFTEVSPKQVARLWTRFISSKTIVHLLSISKEEIVISH